MTTEHPAGRPSAHVAGLRTAVVLTGLLALVATGAAALTGGRAQVVGALAGAALVGFFFVFGALSTSLAAAYAPAMSLLVALLTYTLQVVLLGLVLLAVNRSGLGEDELDRGWLAGTVIVGTLVWMVALVVGAVRSREPLYDLPPNLPSNLPANGDRGEARG